MKHPPCILYLGGFSNNASQCLKLDGIRRWGAALGWETIMVERPDSTPENLPALLRQHHPTGCICEGSGHWVDLPPRLFGKIPVAYIEYPPKVAGRAPNILVDDNAIARAAVQELSAGRPTCYAVVGFPRPWLWSRLRVHAFRRAVAAIGGKCVVFPLVPVSQWEEEADFEKRLVPWLASLPRGCAVFTVCDEIVKNVAAAARSARRHIPKDLTLLSTDNIADICEASDPPISSIQIDFERMGFLAARALGERISRKTREGDKPIVGPLMTVRRKSTSGRGRHEKFILEALETIRREACGGLSASDVIGHSPVSKRLFTMRFREATGHSVLDEIIHVRLEKAFALLAQTDIAIGAIPGLCGFRCDRTLDAIFRKRFGMSMSAWRRRNAL